MDIKRFWHSIRLYTMFNAKKRGDYARKHKLFHHIGENVRLPSMLLPLHSELISIHNNVEIASGVRLVTHDAIHGVLNVKYNTNEFKENIGCIEIMDHCFVGSNTVVLGNVRIGPNAIIGACSFVNHDVPEGTVYAGVPAKEVSSFDKLVENRVRVYRFNESDEYWENFYSEHK